MGLTTFESFIVGVIVGLVACLWIVCTVKIPGVSM